MIIFYNPLEWEDILLQWIFHFVFYLWHILGYICIFTVVLCSSNSRTDVNLPLNRLSGSFNVKNCRCNTLATFCSGHITPHLLSIAFLCDKFRTILQHSMYLVQPFSYSHPREVGRSYLVNMNYCSYFIGLLILNIFWKVKVNIFDHIFNVRVMYP